MTKKQHVETYLYQTKTGALEPRRDVDAGTIWQEHIFPPHPFIGAALEWQRTAHAFTST